MPGSGWLSATLTSGRAGFPFVAVNRLAARFVVCFTSGLRCAAVRVVRVARIVFALPGWSSFTAWFLASVNFWSLLPALDNMFVGALVVPGLLPKRRESPRRLRMIALDLAFAAAVRMIHRIHGHAANSGVFPVPSLAT